MATTYLVLNVCVLGVVTASLIALRTVAATRATLVTIGILLVTTLVFDSLLIAAGIFGYNPALILGVRPFGAPIEDFFYSVLAGLLVPGVWHYTKRRKP